MAAASSSVERDIELLRQQLSLKDAVIAELRESKAAAIASSTTLLEGKDAVIAEIRAVVESRDVLIAHLQQCTHQSKPDGLATRTEAAEALVAQHAQQLAAAEVRLQQLETVSNISKSGCCANSNSSSSSSSSSSEQPVHQQKRARSQTTSMHALDRDEILDEIFSYVGRKEWLYAGGACRRWRGRYLSMCYKARTDKDEHLYQTGHRSSFVTAARFSMALESGLELPDEDEAGDFFDDLPKLSQQPIEVLTLARVHGAAWHEDMCRDAAYYGNLELLRWLYKSGCPWSALIVATNAVRNKKRRNTHTLPWLFSTVDHWSQADKNELLFEAGVMQDIAALELVLEQGAEWPSSYIGEQDVSEGTVRACWQREAVAWARSRGSPSGAWRCQELSAELYTGHFRQHCAKRLFKWAHQHGCPCTCEPPAL
jgi:hypothetical protein